MCEIFHENFTFALSEKPLLLIVDDDPLISDALSYAFAQDFDIVTSHIKRS